MSLHQGMQCQVRKPQVSSEHADMTLGRAPCCKNSQVRPRKLDKCANCHPWLNSLAVNKSCCSIFPDGTDASVFWRQRVWHWIATVVWIH